MKDILDLEKPHPDYVLKPHELLNISASLAILVKDVADSLEKKYPGWLWTINPFEAGGVIHIFSLRLSGEWGYTIRIADIQDDPKRIEAMRAGGTILERFGIRRGPYKHRLLKGKIQAINGGYLPDNTDRPGAEQRRMRDRELSVAVRNGTVALRTEDFTDEHGKTHRKLFMKIGDDDAG